ncbi:sugar ABC transporter substrate-binding protein [Cohnella sp. CIP 111063]|uniref:ABC transporter substrate-binding protein n=1 Tax=unclassified Cohnella TaxID=2636738 RepID=UPI000B8C447F|nr:MULTISPECIES: extracellular solute-binding protein [unclassified Cohnella]OXS54015.1 sugar ABC transporter substrate-binding protein [Cohnella sp. CIP 111063]PRX62888.1 raffinose/stachyose/melibiose transport system substrate-binding protein [Cohnella sp. SGD-V74]
MKKALYFGLVLVLVASFLSACGSGGNKETSPSASAANSPSSSASPSESAKADTPPQKVELKVFMSFPRFKDQFEAYFAQFKAKELAEKNIDVTIKLEMPNPDQAKQILQTRLASNDAPDLFTLHAIADIPTYYKAGYLSDLSDQPFVPKVYESVRNTVTYDGKVVALPLESLSWGYLYNKKIFAEQGIAPPLTLDEMQAAIDKLNAANVKPFVLAFQESWIPQLMMALSLGGTVSSAHPDWIERMNKGEASYKDVASVFDIIDLIMANGTSKPFEVGGEAGSADFASGKGAMWVQGPWQAETILKVNPDMEFGVAPLPVSNDPAGAMINLATSTSLAVSPTSKNKEVALDLLNYILDDQASAPLFEELKFNPVATMHTYETFPWISEASSYVAQGKAYLDLSLPGGVTDETAKLLQSYYAKDVTKDEIIATLDKAWAKGVQAQQ